MNALVVPRSVRLTGFCPLDFRGAQVRRGVESGLWVCALTLPAGVRASALAGTFGASSHMREAGAGAMADAGAGVRGWLQQLQEFVSAPDRCSAAGASYQLIHGLGQECVLSSSSAVLGGYGAWGGGPACQRSQRFSALM